MCVPFRGPWLMFTDLMCCTICGWRNGVCANVDIRWSLLDTVFDSIYPWIPFMACVLTPWHSSAWAFANLVALFVASEACRRLSLVGYKSAVAFNLHVWRNMFPYANGNKSNARLHLKSLSMGPYFFLYLFNFTVNRYGICNLVCSNFGWELWYKNTSCTYPCNLNRYLWYFTVLVMEFKVTLDGLNYTHHTFIIHRLDVHFV
jgi:hypothetical protein